MNNTHIKTIAAALARLDLLNALADTRGLAPTEQAERDALADLAPTLREARELWRQHDQR